MHWVLCNMLHSYAYLKSPNAYIVMHDKLCSILQKNAHNLIAWAFNALKANASAYKALFGLGQLFL